MSDLGTQGATLAQELQSGTIPQVAALPEALRVIFEDIYAQAIAHSFLIAVPVAIVSLIAIVFLMPEGIVGRATIWLRRVLTILPADHPDVTRRSSPPS